MEYTSLGQEEKDKGVQTEWQTVYVIRYITNTSNLLSNVLLESSH